MCDGVHLVDADCLEDVSGPGCTALDVESLTGFQLQPLQLHRGGSEEAAVGPSHTSPDGAGRPGPRAADAAGD